MTIKLLRFFLLLAQPRPRPARARYCTALKKTLCEYSAHRDRRLHLSPGKNCLKRSGDYDNDSIRWPRFLRATGMTILVIDIGGTSIKIGMTGRELIGSRSRPARR